MKNDDKLSNVKLKTIEWLLKWFDQKLNQETSDLTTFSATILGRL